MGTTLRILLIGALASCVVSSAHAKDKLRKSPGELVTFAIANLDDATPKLKAHKLRRALLRIEGITGARVDRKARKVVVRITSDRARLSVEALVTQHGFSVVYPGFVPKGDQQKRRPVRLVELPDLDEVID